MRADAPVVEAPPGSLGAAVSRRSPLVTAALDAEHAWARARAWAQRALPDAVIDAVDVRSVLYQPDGGCTLRYRVRVAPRGREHVLLVEVPRSGDIVARPFPADPGLPTLPRALDPVLMRAVLGRVVPGTGGDRGIGRCAVDVVHHPRRGRCVLRYRLSPGAGGPGELRHPVVFGKVYRDDTASAAASALRVLRAGLPLLPDRGRIGVPEPLAVVPSLRLGLVEAIAGRPLLPDLVKAACDLGAPDPEPPSAIRAAAQVAAAVHACGPGASRFPVRDLAGEQAATERDLGLLEPVWPEAAARLRRGVAHALAAEAIDPPASGWPVAPGLAHGDFTPGQILLDACGGAALVDVDTLCLAEPALDVGRFLAYLHVTGIRRSPTAWPLLAGLTATFLETYLGAGTPPGGASVPAPGARRLFLERTAAYRALSLARLGASACWQLKDDRLGAVVDVLDAGNDWMGSAAG
jgi:hypothetical protein